MLGGGQKAAVWTLIGSCCFMGSTGAAQAEGLEVGLVFSERLFKDEDGSRARSRFDLSVSSEQRDRSLVFTLGGNVDLGFSDGVDDGLDSPEATLTYQIQSRQTAVELSLGYSEFDIETTTDVIAEDGGTDFVNQDGTVQIGTAATTVDFGREANFGGQVGFSLRSVRYEDTNDPGLIDTDLGRGDLRFDFSIVPTIDTRTVFFYEKRDRIGGVDVDRFGIGIGAAAQIDKVTSVDVEIGLEDVETSDGGTDEQGLYLDYTVERTLRDGALIGSVTSELLENGRRTEAEIAREFERENWSLTTGLGAGKNEDRDLQALYRVEYTRAFKRSELDFNIGRTLSTTVAGEDIVNTTLGLGYTMQLSELATIAFDAAIFDIEFPGGGDDTERLAIGIRYDQQLTDRWTLIGGYNHFRRQTDAGVRETDDQFFVGLETAVQWRP